jgi:serpin B
LNTKKTFHAPSGDVKTTMMEQTNTFRYARAGGVRALEMEYWGGEFSMLVLLPDANDGLSNLEKVLSPSELKAWDSRLEPALVSVTFPKFNSEMSLKLTQTLQSMGARSVFSGAADLSGIAAERIYVSDVIHKARVEVTEKGTEAAAATAIIAPTMAALPRELPKPEIFKADHPFIYILRRTGGSVFFIGRLLNPASM